MKNYSNDPTIPSYRCNRTVYDAVGMEEMTYRPPREPVVPIGGIDCQARDMTASVSADVTLRQLQSTLAGHGQWLPIDGDPEQTVGTLVAADSTGPLRLGYGAWRDLLLGVQFTNGRGELISAGGRTVKNVAGYDLTKFIIGQRGTFGRIVTITTRTYRLPAGAIIARHEPDIGKLNRLIPGSLKPQWAVLTKDALLCGYVGDSPTVEFYRSMVPRTEPIEWSARSIEQDISHRTEIWRAAGPIVFRASVPPARLLDFSTALQPFDWVADAAFGIVLGSCPSRHDAGPILTAAHQLGGGVRLFDGPWGQPLELSTTPVERQIIERLKQAFDPDRQLNPLPGPLS